MTDRSTLALIATPNREAAALVFGRYLSRAQWHLSQSLFVDDSALAAMPASERPPSQEFHRKHGMGAIEQIRLLVPTLQLGNPDTTSEAIESSFLNLGRFNHNESILKDFELANDEAFQHEQGDKNARSAGELRLGFAHKFLTLWLEKIVAAIDAEDVSLVPRIRLGRLIDEGVCRPDVVESMDCQIGPPLLREDAYCSWTIQKSRERNKRGISIDPFTDCRSDPPPLFSTGSRTPGEIAPQEFWAIRVREAFLDMGLEVTAELSQQLEEFDGAKLESLDNNSAVDSSPINRLIGLVDSLFDIAAQQAGSCGSRVLVDHAAGAIWVDGEKYVEDHCVLVLFDLLEDHIGEDNAGSLKKLLEDRPNFPGRKKPCEIKKLVKHPEVRELIQSRQAKGTWRVA